MVADVAVLAGLALVLGLLGVFLGVLGWARSLWRWLES